MSSYTDAFETLADRGTPMGATALLDRVNTSLTEPSIPIAQKKTKTVGGLAVATVAFLAVIAIGAMWVLLRGSAPVVGNDGIEWFAAPNAASSPSVTRGPGGFLLWTNGILGGDGRNGNTVFEFSTDARSWTDVTPSRSMGHMVRSVEASADHWLLLLDDGSALVSEDAQSWVEIRWPDDLEPFIDQVVGSGTGFFAVGIDPFGEGTTLWRSPDGTTWSKQDAELPGAVAEATLEGTEAGLAWYGYRATGSQQEIYHTTDGSSWLQGTITLPPDYAATASGWLVGPVTVADSTWFAFGEVFTTGEVGTHLLVWTSPDGVTWQYRGSPEFASVPDHSVGIATSAVLGDRLVVEPRISSGGEIRNGDVNLGGDITPTGRLWTTADGSNWTLGLQFDQPIESISGGDTDSGRLVGVYVPAPTRTTSDGTVTTTNAALDPGDLDQDGLALQEEIISDGRVTEEEFIQALQGWKSCMEGLEVTMVAFERDPDGTYSFSYSSAPSGDGNTEDNFCTVSYIEQVNYVLWHQG